MLFSHLGLSGLKLDGTVSNDDVFCSDVLESSDVHIDPHLIPDVSPIKSTDEEQKDGGENDVGDGGPMKISEISHVSMEYENDEANTSSVEMDVVEPLTSTHYTEDNSKLAADDLKEPNSSHDKLHDVIAGDVKHDVIDSRVNGDVRYGDDRNIASRTGNDQMPENADGYSGVNLDNWEYKKENVDVQQGISRDNYADEALVQRACAAMKRADRLVRESCLDQSASASKRSGTSMGYLDMSHVDKPLNHVNNYLSHVDKNFNHVDIPHDHVAKSWYHVNKAWHPIDMSTPLVSDKAKIKQQNVDANSRRPLLDTDSYNNLLSSFANSKLDQRSSSPDEESVFLSRDVTLGSRSRNRIRCQGTGTRTSRSLSSIGKRSFSNQGPLRRILLYRLGSE